MALDPMADFKQRDARDKSERKKTFENFMGYFSPYKGSFVILVSFPEGLKTNYGSSLAFRFEAKGSADIITNDRRLIQRLFDNLKYRLKKV